MICSPRRFSTRFRWRRSGSLPAPSALRAVVGQEEGRRFPSQPRDDQLPHLALVAVQLDLLIHIADLTTLPLGLGDLAALPGAGRQTLARRASMAQPRRRMVMKPTWRWFSGSGRRRW